MRFLSVCSGIEAASVAWKSLGWQPVGFSEIEPFPCAVLKHRFPNVSNFGDMRKFKEWPIEPGTVGLLVGGTPCQSFSIAGLRGGLEDERGNLMLVYGTIAAHFRPAWLLWENVPGVLSSNAGLDFASFLGLLTGRLVSVPVGGWRNSGILAGIPDAYGIAWASLDAQYFGVPQRRERVFVVGYLGDWLRAASVLFESESMQRHNPPRRKQGEGASHTLAPSLTASGRGVERTGESRGQDPVIAVLDARGNGNDVNTLTGDHASRPTDYTPLIFDSRPAMTLNAKGGSGRMDAESETFVTHSLRGEGFDGSEDGTGRDVPLVSMAFDTKASGRNGFGVGDQSPTLRAMSGERANGDGQIGVSGLQGVRRLTPVECERLQEFPDNWTKIPTWNGWRKMGIDETPEQLQDQGIEVRQSKKTGKWSVKDVDGPRYKALGNSMHTGTIRWIGRRIQMVDDLMNPVVVDFDALRFAKL